MLPTLFTAKSSSIADSTHSVQNFHDQPPVSGSSQEKEEGSPSQASELTQPVHEGAEDREESLSILNARMRCSVVSAGSMQSRQKNRVAQSRAWAAWPERLKEEVVKGILLVLEHKDSIEVMTQPLPR